MIGADIESYVYPPYGPTTLNVILAVAPTETGFIVSVGCTYDRQACWLPWPVQGANSSAYRVFAAFAAWHPGSISMVSYQSFKVAFMLGSALSLRQAVRSMHAV